MEAGQGVFVLDKRVIKGGLDKCLAKPEHPHRIWAGLLDSLVAVLFNHNFKGHLFWSTAAFLQGSKGKHAKRLYLQ